MDGRGIDRRIAVGAGHITSAGQPRGIGPSMPRGPSRRREILQIVRAVDIAWKCRLRSIGRHQRIELRPSRVSKRRHSELCYRGGLHRLRMDIYAPAHLRGPRLQVAACTGGTATRPTAGLFATHRLRNVSEEMVGAPLLASITLASLSWLHKNYILFISKSCQETNRAACKSYELYVSVSD